jgi:hypothetical protein
MSTWLAWDPTSSALAAVAAKTWTATDATCPTGKAAPGRVAPCLETDDHRFLAGQMTDEGLAVRCAVCESTVSLPFG